MADLERQNKNIEWLIFVILTFIFIVSLFGFLYLPRSLKTDSIFDLLIALIPNIMASILVFSIGYYVFSVREIRLRDKANDEINEKLERLLLNEKANTEFITNEYIALENLFKNVDNINLMSIDMIGYSMAHVFQQYRDVIIRLLKAGVKIRVLVLDPNSIAGQLMSQIVGDPELVSEPHLRTLRYIKNINAAINEDNHSNVILVRKMVLIPSSTVILFKGADNFFSMFLGINGFAIRNDIDRRLYSVTTLDYKDKKFRFFESHYEMIWNNIQINKQA